MSNNSQTSSCRNPLLDGASKYYDAMLLVSFGGPEGLEDVLPFLENVLRGKNVPPERMLQVAEHYKQFNGLRPIHKQNRRLIAALERSSSDGRRVDINGD